MREIMKRTKELCQSYLDPQGNFYKRPFGIMENVNLTKRKDDFLRRYVYAIMNTKLTSAVTKIYMRSVGASSVASAIKSHNRTLKEKDKLNINSCESSIFYDTTAKLLKYFPDEMLTEVIYYDTDITRYEKQLNLALARYSNEKNKLKDNLILRIHCNSVKDSCTDEEFMILMKLIAPYFKKQIKEVEDKIPDTVGYLLYIISTHQSNLSVEDKARYKMVQEMFEE